MNTAHYFRKAAARFGDCPAFVDAAGSFTYAQTEERMNRVANGLAALGLRPGDRVAGILKNRREYVEVRYGALNGGFVYVRLNVKSAPEQNARLVADAEARVLFVEAEFLPQLSLSTAPHRAPEHVVVLGGGGRGALEYEDFLAQASPAPPADPGVSLDGLATINYTSGTTGQPKGGMLSHRAWYMRTRNFLSLMDPPESDDVMLHVTPLSHASSIFLEPYATGGACQVILDTREVEAILDAIACYRVTRVFLVPTLIYRLVDSPLTARYDLRSLRTVHYGGSPISPVRLAEAVKKFGPIFEQFYGSVEALPPLSFFSKADHATAMAEPSRRGLASAGRIHPHLEVRVVDTAGRLVGPEEEGDIVTRGDHTMLGYWKRPDATKEKVTGGWLRTGDVGRVGQDGRLYIVDRRDDVIISGGFNVYPSEVEMALAQHPAVAEVAVVGTPDNEWGEAVTAFVVPRQGMEVQGEEIRKWARTVAGGHQVPKLVHVVAELPKNAYGKILRRDLREPYWAGRERRVN